MRNGTKKVHAPHAIPDGIKRTKADDLAIQEGCYWDESKGQRVIDFFERYLTLSSGVAANQPFRLLSWQIEFIEQLFCWRRKDGRRRFTRALLHSGKKIGKSALVAGLGLYLTMADGVDSPLVAIGASAREQAAEVFREITFSIQHNNRLRNALHIVPSQKYIQYPKRNGNLRAISWDAPAKGGWNCSACILDEVCQHYDGSLYEMLKSSMIARAEPLMLMLSNAGYNKAHFYYSLYQQAKAILSGESTDTSFLPVVYEVPEEADWKDRTEWPKANPSLGTVLTWDPSSKISKML